ncbi:MAG TPA: RDD family protein [Thermoanaerobaculia bacterium]|nr:RDD family protein [Thermoanaerobaculia bacterium]
MNSDTRRARGLALWLDLLIPAAVVDALGLAATAAVWYLRPAAAAYLGWVWGALAAAALIAFLLRDANGGRARRWLGFEVRDGEGGPPGLWRSTRRNLPLLVPGWNLLEVWPVFRDGKAPRRSDRQLGTLLISGD